MDPCEGIDGTLLGCPACGGIWLDNQTSELLAADALDERAQQFVRTLDQSVDAARLEMTGAYRSIVEGVMGCLVCGEPLLTVEVENVEIDICEAHGAFFDHLEVRGYLFEKASRKMGIASQAAATRAAHAQELRAFAHDLNTPDNERRAELMRKSPILTLILERIHAWRRPT